jgi:hypothetical protein
MNIVGILEDSFAYAKDAIWGKWIKWLLLIVFCIIFPLFLGYVAEILRGRKPAPELENWGKMFIDGLKIFVAVIIYAIPVIVVAFISGISTFLILNPFTAFAAFTGFIAVIIVAIIVGIFATIGIIRLARTGKVEEAFNFSEINQRINSIGWANYILALIILQVVLLIIQTIIAHIPAIGGIINFVLTPFYGIFSARYLCLIYDYPETRS